jgi:pSer/pThr/pTyr-binding forkhead associated (FHA) protein
LHVVDADSGRSKNRKHSITQAEVYLGSDVSLSQIVIDDPALDGMHALIRRDDDGRFYIVDMGTTAGTWLNYDPVSAEGQEIKHGDVVHIGSAAFNFQIPGAKTDSEIEINFLDGGDKTGD